MPARQDQTLQIFLIIFIFAFLVSAVVAYLGWKGYSDTEQQRVALEGQLRDRTQQTQTQQTEIEDLREMAGFSRNDNTADVKKAAIADLRNYGRGVPYDGPSQWARNDDEGGEAIPPYRLVLHTVFNDYRQSQAREAKLQEERKEFEARLKALEAEKEAQIAQAEEARKKAQEDAAAQRNEFTKFRTQLENDKKELMAKVDSQKTDFETRLGQRETRIKEMEERITNIERANKILIEQRQDEPGSFEVADGRVSWVNQNEGTVWINLGSADSLRRQITFSVFDGDQHDAAKATKKGSIEVTRILGPHLAEARITDDSSRNPIIPGDQIYSQVWHRGKQLRFALAGIIDITGDGRNDMQLARELIELNGGIIDAHMTEDGKVEGEITPYTRYLVLGDFPELATQVNMQDAWHEMNREAGSMGVQTITLHQFLNQMGYRPQDRTVQLGEGASARDFPARPDNGRPAGDRRFRPRPAPNNR